MGHLDVNHFVASVRAARFTVRHIACLGVLLGGLVTPTLAGATEPERSTAAPLDALQVANRPAAAGTPASTASDLVFETHIRPILRAHCTMCHGEDGQHEGNLDLRLVRSAIHGGEAGTSLVPHDPANSPLLQRILSGEMPPGDKKVSDAEAERIRAWIASGAPTLRPEPEAPSAADQWTTEDRAHWAFQPIVAHRPPVVAGAAEHPTESVLETPIDAFVLSALQHHDGTFAPPADRATWLRRVTFDLLGLPPTPEEVRQFVASDAPDAHERVLDELLARPQFGERWARHWLDVAGYADSDGYTQVDPVRPWSFAYRDYLVRSFNADRSFRELIIEQLAGDELLQPGVTPRTPEEIDRLVATGFLRTAPDGTEQGGVDANVARNDLMADTIKIVSSSLLGMTVGCAQCHTHRYDPISQVDYYQMRAIFEPAYDWKNWRNHQQRIVSLWTPEEQALAAQNDQELAASEKQRIDERRALADEVFERELLKLDDEDREAARDARNLPADKRTPYQAALYQKWVSLTVDLHIVQLFEVGRTNEIEKRAEARAKEIRAKRPRDNSVACLNEVPGQVPTTVVFFRGDINSPRQPVPPADLSILGGTPVPEDDPAVPTTGRRLNFARHLTTGEHPLVTRVLVNRFWMHLFGRGLVATPADFGALGQRPSHPELLDFLAHQFGAEGWSLKRSLRQSLLSRTYRQDSVADEAWIARDPDNIWLGRFSLRRLEAEAIRDAMLAASGTLSDKMYGPAIPVVPNEVGQIIVGTGMTDGNGILIGSAAGLGEDEFRRGLYVQVRRTMPLGMHEPFDAPGLVPNCELRTRSTVATQSLLMLNNLDVVAQSERLAARLMRECPESRTDQVRRCCELLLGRQPVEDEVALATAFLAEQTAAFEAGPTHSGPSAPPAAPVRALAVLCQSLICTNEFLYLD